MDCTCRRINDRVCTVDERCIPLMHTEYFHFYSKNSPETAVPDDSMFNFGIYLDVGSDGVVFDCGCSMTPDGEIMVWSDCHERYHPELRRA